MPTRIELSGNETWPRDALPRDTVLHGYRVTHVLGRGGFGITYRAVDRIDQEFAIKEYFPRQFALRQGSEVLPADAAAQDMFADCLNRFTNEARALTVFSRQTEAGGNPAAAGVVRASTYFELNGTAYIVMEFVEGEGLDRVFAAHPQGLPERDLLRILRTLLPALASVHANHLLHRDIKPANIVIRPNGQPVLLDFGAARVNDPAQTNGYTQIFTENYAPIEQMQGQAQGPWSDIYALGATCYEAIAGAARTGSATMSLARQAALLSHQPDPLPPAVRIGAGRYAEAVLRAIDWSLAVMPGDRPQSVASLAVAFGVAMPGAAMPGGANATRIVTPPSPVQSGLRARWVMAACGLTVLLGAGALAAVFLSRPAPPRAPAPPPRTGINAPAPPSAKPAAPQQTAAPLSLLDRYRAAAETGDVHAQYQLAYALQNGIGVMADFSTALIWYRRAADTGYAAAQSQIGFMYVTGQAGRRDYGEAMRWLRLAAAQNYAPAEYQLGYMAQHGLGMKRDFAAMRDWYTRAARQGSAQGQQQLGYCYQMGLGVEKNYAEAVRWYTLAAGQKLPAAMFSLGQMYFTGLGVAADHAAGRDWISRAAAAGDAEAARWQTTH